jgi:hypothetical protein
MPIGVRMPVVSMSTRLRIGCVKAFVQPGSWSRAFISWTRSSRVMGTNSGQSRLSSGRMNSACSRRTSAARSFVRHSLRGLSVNDGLDHRERRRIRGRIGAPDLAEHRRDLGKASQDLVLPAGVAARLLDGDVREGRRHVEQVALVERRHELRAEPRAMGSADTNAITPMSTVVFGLCSATWTKGS